MFAVFAINAAAQNNGGGAWLNERNSANWNENLRDIPSAPRASSSQDFARCREQIRQPENINDRALNRAGWSLYGATQLYGGVSLIKGLTNFDGMCRPEGFQVFIFNGNRFVGTLSPSPMNSRTDGSLILADLISPDEIRAEFARFSSSDAFCCPSKRSTVLYEMVRRPNSINSILQVKNVVTENFNQTQTNETPDNPRRATIRGTIAYRERIALSQTAVVRVRLVDLTNPNAPTAVAESEFNALGKQVPLPFELTYETARLQPSRSYGVTAEILNQGASLFITPRPFNLSEVRGNLDLNLVMSASLNQPETSPIKPIRGISLYLSEYGRGSVQIANRAAENINRTVVQIRTDASVTIDVYRPRTGRITFTGDLIGYDQDTIRVRVLNSGNAEASGEIVVKHGNRRINSLSISDLILDGQNVNLNFAR